MNTVVNAFHPDYVDTYHPDFTKSFRTAEANREEADKEAEVSPTRNRIRKRRPLANKDFHIYSKAGAGVKK
jgi:hypothetical protein